MGGLLLYSMGNRASKVVPKEFPKTPNGTASNRSHFGEKANSSKPEPAPITYHTELSEEEIRIEQEQEKEMRAYLDTLQGLTGSISEREAGFNEKIVPDGVKFAKNLTEEKQKLREIKEQQEQDHKKFTNRLG